MIWLIQDTGVKSEWQGVLVRVGGGAGGVERG